MSRVLAGFLILACTYAGPVWAQTGTVSGTVTRAASATPAADVTLALCTASYSCEYGSTDASGAYTVSAEPGTYYLWTENDLGLIDEIYENLQCPGACDLWLAVPSGTPIIVTSGAVLSGRDFALDPGGAIAGTVVNAATAMPVSGILVYAYSFDGTTGRYAGYGATNAAGAYTISGLPTGTYFTHTYNNSGLVNEIFDNVQCTGSCSVSNLRVQGSPIAVLVGATTANKNFALEPGGTISGTVRNSATLAPLNNVTVYIVTLATNGSWSSATYAFTNAAGVYSAGGLPTGTYYAYTSNSGAFLNEVYDNVQCAVSCTSVTGGTPIPVMAGAITAGKNFDLDVGGAISGVVTRQDTSSPINGVSVYAYKLTAAGGTEYASSGSTDTAGAFTIPRLLSGTYYLYTSNSAGFVNEIFDNVGCPGDCQIYTLTSLGTGVAVTVGATTANRNFALVPGGGFSGTVTNGAGGTPIKDAYVFVMARDAAGVSTYATSATTNASGAYEVKGLPTGTYYAYTDRAGYQNKIYNDVWCVGSCVAATAATAGDPIAVVAGESHPGINFLLNAGGSISGTVRSAATSAGLGSVYVYAYRKGGDGYADYAGYGATNAFGVYTISGLPTGEYYVMTSLSGYQNQIFPAVNCVKFCSSEFAQSFGTPVPVINGAAISGYDFALNEATGRVIGTITNSVTMGPAPEVYVYFYARVGGSEVYAGYGYSNASGVYELIGLPPGTYFAVTNSYGPFIDEIHPDIPCFTSCDYGTGAITVGAPIVVGTGTVTLNFGLQPRPAVQLPGQVQSLSARIANATVAFTWAAPYEFGTPDDYLLEVGLAPGTTLISIPVAARSYTAPGVPPGRYFARVRGRNAAGVGSPSDEYEFVVNPDGSGAPDAPANLQVLLEGGELRVSWSGPSTGGHVTGYVVEVGSATGLSNIATVPVGGRSLFTHSGPVPPGVYFVRVRASNAMSVGKPSLEVMMVAGGVPAPPDPPGNIGFAVDAARGVTIGWLPPRGVVIGYLLEVGSAKGRSDLGVFPIAASATSMHAPAVPPGTYYVRLRAINAQGTGVASYETTVIVP